MNQLRQFYICYVYALLHCAYFGFANTKFACQFHVRAVVTLMFCSSLLLVSPDLFQKDHCLSMILAASCAVIVLKILSCCFYYEEIIGKPGSRPTRQVLLGMVREIVYPGAATQQRAEEGTQLGPGPAGQRKQRWGSISWVLLVTVVGCAVRLLGFEWMLAHLTRRTLQSQSYAGSPDSKYNLPEPSTGLLDDARHFGGGVGSSAAGGVPVHRSNYWVAVEMSFLFGLVQMLQFCLAWDATVLIWSLFDPSYLCSPAPFMDSPWLSTSLGDLWSRRWHQVFRPDFKRLAYLPVRNLLDYLQGAAKVPARKEVFAAQQQLSPLMTNAVQSNGHTGQASNGLTRRGSKPGPGKTDGKSPADGAAAVFNTYTDGHLRSAISTADKLQAGQKGKHHKRAAQRPYWHSAVASVAVFMLSGLVHEYMLWAAFGRASGLQLLFFTVHGIGLVVERAVVLAYPGFAAKVPPVVGWLLTVIFTLLTSPLYMWPWLDGNYHVHMLRLGIFRAIEGQDMG